MQADITGRISPRIPLVAALLSLVTTGLGQVYCGRLGKGLVLFVIGIATGAIGLFAVFPVPWWMRGFCLAMLAISAAVWVYAIIDAGRIAARTPPGYALKDYNRWYVYVLLVLLSLPLGLAVSVHLQRDVVKAYYLVGSYMYPTVSRGDRVLANRLAYRSEPVRRGDVVAFPHPNRRHATSIQRVAAMPGDTIEIRDSEVYVNGLKLPRESIAGLLPEPGMTGELFWEVNGQKRYRVLLPPAGATRRTTDKAPYDLPKTEIPNGHCFVLTDNRTVTEDSRSFGPVPLRDLVGRVDWRYFPRPGRLSEPVGGTSREPRPE